jgi:MerR family transcriptional regulator, copper efflux regulator
MPRRLEILDEPRAPALDAREPVDESALMQVGELAKATGKTVRAIHLYESLGLLNPVRRSKGRYRLFSPDAKVRISWINKLRSLGLSLTDIQEIVEQRRASPSAQRAAAELKQVYEEKLLEVKETLRKFRELESELEASLAFLETCKNVCEHDVKALDCASCRQHPEEDAPELVVGAPPNLTSLHP